MTDKFELLPNAVINTQSIIRNRKKKLISGKLTIKTMHYLWLYQLQIVGFRYDKWNWGNTYYLII